MEKHKKFHAFFTKYDDELVSYKKGMLKQKNPGITLHHRKCVEKGRAKTKSDVEKDMAMGMADNLIDILGDEDIDLEGGFMDISQTSSFRNY